MVDKLRHMVQKLKDKVHLPQISTNGREKVDQLITKYVPPGKVNEIAERFRQENLTNRVKELVSKYEKFTGVEEIMAIQNTVIDAQERFIAAQDRRRDVGKQVANIEARLKELHAEMQNTMKGDDKYLHLCTEEHKLIIQERSLRAEFSEAEREERELFATMSAAVKLGHERERAHAERNKYWYIVASIFGTVLGIAGSTINNRLKMAEFRDMMEQQMARSASVLYTIAGGGAASRADITDAMKTEFAYQKLQETNKRPDESALNESTSILKHQAKLAENMKIMQDNIDSLISKQSSLIDHLSHQEHTMEKQMRDLKKIVIAAAQTTAKSDAELAKALSVVQHDIDDEKDKDTHKIVLEPNQIVTGVAVVVFVAMIFGGILGRAS